MADLLVNELNKYYGSNHVLKGVSFEVYEGEKVGLLGKNGSGKTTLFKILTGQEAYESGNINIAKNREAEILDQIPYYPDAFSALDVINTAFDRILHLSVEMKKLETLMVQSQKDELLNKYGKLQMEFEASDGYTMDSSIETVCNGLGISNEIRQKSFEVLSGGEKTRVNLARILLKKADILLLDEPTNHLDIKAIEWLEEFLSRYKGTVVIISHDRFFLDKTISRVIELEDGKAEFYAGNYSYYIQEKEDRFLRQLSQYEEQHKKVEQLEKAAKRMHEWAKRADSGAMHRRAFSIEKRIERMDKIDKPKEDKKINGEFSESNFSGKDVVLFKNVYKAYNTKVLLDNFDSSVRKNERIAILGDNGCGKTTILRLITGDEISDKGSVKVGDSIKVAYLQQLITFENPKLSILETVRYALETNEETARKVLVPFHFKGKDILKIVDTLSGGEKSRLRLCLLMQTDCNLLLLDEPTNHLDIASKEWIEKSVSEFKGTVAFVSHDRYFINRFATRIWEIKDGKITDFKGTYKELNEWKQREEIDKNNAKLQKIKLVATEVSKQFKEVSIEKEKNLLESSIAGLDEEIKVLDMQLEEASSDYKHLERLMNEKNKLVCELESLYEKWLEM
jgi:ATP-binding cassette, subfamily F, member 3